MCKAIFGPLVLVLLIAACSTPLSTPAGSNNTPTMTAAQVESTPTSAPRILALNMLDVNNGWAWAGSARLLYTSDGGMTWIDRTPENPKFMPFWPIASLDANDVWMPISFNDNNGPGLLHTTDGGQTWTEYPNGPLSGPTTSLHFADALNGWAETADVGAGNLYITLSETNDGGKTWEPIPVTPPNPETGLPPGTVHLCNICAYGFYYDPRHMVTVSGDMGSMEPSGFVSLQTSFDLGKTWQAQKLPLPNGKTDALVGPSRTVFFDSENGILFVHLIKISKDGSYTYQGLAFYTSHDGGASWSLLPNTLDDVAAFEPPAQVISSQDIFILCGSSLCVSHDGAQSWKSLASNLDFTQNDQRYVSQIDFVNANTGWVLIRNNEATALYKSSNGGQTWVQLTPLLVSSAPVTVSVDTNIPTPTSIPTATLELTLKPTVSSSLTK